MRINYNESAVLANSCLNRTDSKLSESIERLSSGLKINHAKDNPAGFAISNRMDAQIGGIGVATNNTNDGISVVETADGAMSEITAIIQRMSELAVQAGHGIKTDDDRVMIDAEIQQLKEEITRIARDTEFNGQVLLDGTFDLKGYTDNPNVKVSTYSDETPIAEYNIDFAGLLSYDAAADTYEVDVNILKAADQRFANLPEIKASYDGENINISGYGNFEMSIGFDYPDTLDRTNPSDVVSFINGQAETKVDITGIGAMKIQVGANEGQEIAVRIPEISLKRMGIEDMDVLSFDNAQKAIESIKGALNYVSEVRARLGAYQNRMEHNVSNLSVTNENMTASYSRIMDIDMAEEMTEYTTQQVLSQAGVSMLSQANERPQMILQLLQ